MFAHPAFGEIALHTDAELKVLLGAAVAHRETIHEWPLSCVQALTLEGGKRLIYKSQLPPTVEPEFYQAAKTDLLPECICSGQFGRCAVMALEWIDAPTLGAETMGDAEWILHGKRLIERIGAMGGNLPVYLDIGSAPAWELAARETLMRLRALIAHGRFQLIDPGALDALARWSGSPGILGAVSGDTRVVHGDLKGDQVFFSGGGYRVIDWQRPYLAPPEIDLVSLLLDRKIDPRGVAQRTSIDLFWFLRLHWAVEAQYALFPDHKWGLFNRWATEAIENILRT